MRRFKVYMVRTDPTPGRPSGGTAIAPAIEHAYAKGRKVAWRTSGGGKTPAAVLPDQQGPNNQGGCMNWYLSVLKKYAVFTGRARRQEYWMFLLFNIIIMVVLAVIEVVIGTWGILGMVYALAVLLPSIGVTIRRLHDTDRTGWWILIALVPAIGAIVLLIFMLLDGQASDNQYGPNPKAAAA